MVFKKGFNKRGVRELNGQMKRGESLAIGAVNVQSIKTSDYGCALALVPSWTSCQKVEWHFSSLL